MEIWMSSRAVSSTSSLSPLCYVVTALEWATGWGKFGMLWDWDKWCCFSINCLQQPPRCPGLQPLLSPVLVVSGAHSVTCQGKNQLSQAQLLCLPCRGWGDGARLHSKVHSRQGKYFNYLKWVVDWSYNWGLVSQCYCNVSADPLQQSAQCPHSLQLFKTIEKQHPMEAIAFLF